MSSSLSSRMEGEEEAAVEVGVGAVRVRSRARRCGGRASSVVTRRCR